MTNSFLIRDIEIFDGSGKPPFRGDVAVQNGKIAAIAQPQSIPSSGMTVYDGKDYSLAPGFIDAHGHSELDILDIPSGDNKLSQGFTSEIAGNCGFTEFMEKGMSFPDFIQETREKQIAVNIAVMAGHNSLRTLVMGNENRAPSDAELKEMERLLRLTLQQGSAGFSAGLWYVPGIYAQTEEVCALAAALKGTDKPFTIHLRSEGDTLLESIEEACRIARAGNSILQISHFKTWYPRNWHKLDAALELIREQQASGLKIALDRYPYLYSGTGLRMALPPQFSQMPKEVLHARLKDDPAFHQEVIRITEQAGPSDCPWEQIMLLDSPQEKHKCCFGKNFVEIGKMFYCSPAAACVKLLSEEENPLGAFGLMSNDNLQKILALPFVMPGTDAGIQDFSKQNGHPRKFGTAARFFQLATETQTPQEIIRRMTSFPAEFFHLNDRGLIRKDYHADLVMFRKDSLSAPEDYARPAQPAKGIAAVWVNGVLSYTEQDGITGKRGGVFLQ